jgi:hypothetical protein
MDLQARVADLIASPKARWALAWLSAAPCDEPAPVDFHDAAIARPRSTRLHTLRHNPAGLLAEVHTRIEDWRYNTAARTAVSTLGPEDGYRHMAAELVKSPAAAWWWEPVRRDAQTWICNTPILRARGLPFVTGYGHHWDRTALASAVTTSTRLDRLPAAELLYDQNRWPSRRTPPEALTAWAVQIKPDARVAEIHSPADWVDLVQRYPSHRTDLCLAPDLEARWPSGAHPLTVDWHALSRDYEGVHLSVAGWLTATSQVLSMTTLQGYTFCEGWPTEGTAWFKPVFTGEFEQLAPEQQGHPLHYGYGRPCTGSPHDLRTTAVVPSGWRRWFTSGGRTAE